MTLGEKVVSKHLCSFWWPSRGCQKKWGQQCRQCFGPREGLQDIFAEVTSVACEVGRPFAVRAQKYRECVIDIWQRSAPEKLESAEKIFKKYFGAEAFLYWAVCTKYNEDPEL